MKSLLIFNSFVLLVLLVVPVIPLYINGSNRQSREVTSPVQVNLYYESECPYSREFVLDQLVPTDAKLKKTGIMSLSMFPYGNAHYVVDNKTKDITFTCQHGVEECKGNMILACDMYFTKTQSLDMAECMFASKYWRKTDFANKAGQECALKLGRNWNELKECLDGSRGETLLKKIADETVVHEGVPWILINGKQSNEAQGDLLKVVCDTYTGEKPQECNQ